MQDYTRFSKQRETLWISFAERLAQARKDPKTLTFDALESLAIDYRRILQDQAVAKAAFPSSAAARRLAALAVEATHFLLAEEATDRFSMKRFFMERFPKAMRAHTRHILLCGALFACSILMAYSASLVQPAIGAVLLGETTLANLERGELWTETITRVVPSSISSSAIATNNMSVAITAWVGGALFGLGALYITLSNGFMLGAVFGTTTRFGMTGGLLEFVSAHGPLELTLIMVSAGHGLAMGHALLSPHERSRERAVSAAAREAMIGLVGILPWFLVLGLVEGFISPSPSVAWEVKAALGASLLAGFLLVAYHTPSERGTQ